MADIQLTAGNDFFNLDISEIDRVIIPAGSRSIDLIANFRSLDLIDISNIPETAAVLLEGAIDLSEQGAVRLSGSFGVITLDNIRLGQLTLDNFITGSSPIAVDDTATATAGIPETIAVLENDSDPDNDELSIVTNNFPITTENSGTVANDNNGTPFDPTDDSLVYEAADGFSGTDSFTYTISDGDRTSTATVSVTVEPPPNQPPVAADDLTATTEGVLITIAVLDNDTDPDNGPEALSISGLSETAAGGTVSIDGETLVYTPPSVDTGETLIDSFTYTISDGDLTDAGTVSVTVSAENEAPIAEDDVAVTTEGIPVTIAVLENDSDPENDLLEILGLSRTAAGGTVSIDGETLIYTPPELSETIADSFTYKLSDGQLTSTGTVTVTVEPANNDPIAEDDTTATTEGIAVTIAVLNNDSDADNGPEALSIAGVSEAVEGTISISGETVVYTPPAVDTGETLTDSFTYTISDGDLTDTATVTVTVQAENEPPIAEDDTIATTEGIAVTIAVLDNDTDPEDDLLELSGLSETAAGGTVSIDGETVLYTPPLVDTGVTVTDSFTYTVSDGDRTSSAAVTVTVSAANEGPIAVDDTTATTEGIAVTIAVLDNDTDPEDDLLELSGLSETAEGGTVSIDGERVLYTPPLVDTGVTVTDSFTYTVSDGELTSAAAVTVTVSAANEGPMAVDDTTATTEGIAVTIAVLDNDTDPEDDLLELSGLSETAAGGTVSIDGETVLYTPPLVDTGVTVTDSFTYTVSDGELTSAAAVTVTVSAANEDPMAVDDTTATTEGIAVTIAVLDNDTDPEDDLLELSGLSETAAGGTVSIDGERVLYTPPLVDTGVTVTDSFTYTVSDGELTSAAAVTVTVSAANEGPMAVDDTTATTEGIAVTIAVLDNDTDPEDDLLEISGLSETAEGGTVSIAGDTVIYTPAAIDAAVADSFTYTISDGDLTDTATVTVTVEPGNNPPVAVDDSTATVTVQPANLNPIAADDIATTTADASVEIALLDNDFDLDGDSLSISGVPTSTSLNGTVSISDSTVIYTPVLGFTGTDSFTYTISDGSLTDTATVNIFVGIESGSMAQIITPVPSVQSVDANQTVSIDVQYTTDDPLNSVGNGLGLRLHWDSTQLIFNGLADIFADDFVAEGTVSSDTEDFDGDPNTDSLILVFWVDSTEEGIWPNDPSSLPITLYTANFTTASDFANSTAVNFSASSPSPGFDFRSTSANIAIAASDIPITIAVLDNDSDPENDLLEILGVSETAAGATVSIDDNGTPDDTGDDVLVYSPAPDFTGTDSFTYTISDGLETATATVTVTVAPGNGAPIALPDLAIATEGIPETISVLDNDFDPDGDEISLVDFPSTTDNSGTITIDNNNTAFDPTDDVLVYEAAVDFTGTDSLTYTISDGLFTNTATVTVTVIPGNDRPVAVDDSIVTTEGITTPLMLLDNDFDPNGDDISLVEFATTTAEGGTVTLDNNGTFLDATDDFLVYASAAGFAGTDSFTYTISDGELTDAATVTVTVELGNQPPIAVEDSTSIRTQSIATIAVLANDSDPDGDTLSIASVSNGVNGTVSIAGSEVIYTANEATFIGTDSFTYTITDGNGGTDSATVNVTVVENQNPIANPDDITIEALSTATIAVVENDSDPDGDALSITGFSTASNGTVEFLSNSLVYTPNPFLGTDSFTYTITDDRGATDSAQVNVTVDIASAPLAPIALDDIAFADEGQQVAIAVLENDLELNGEEISIVGFNAIATFGGTVTIDDNGTSDITGDDLLIYTPAAGFTDVDNFRYTISDGSGLTATTSVIVNVVAGPNTSPMAVDDAVTAIEGTPTTIAVLANDSDPEGDPLEITGLSATTAGGTVSIDGDTVVYTPPVVNTGETITDSFTYSISDGSLTDSATVTVTVDAENEAPIAVDDVTVTTEGIPGTIAVLENDSDPENAPLTIEEVSATTAGGTVSISGDTIIYTPPAVDAQVTDSFTYRISDGSLTDAATVTVTVNPENEPPIAVDDEATTTQNIPVTISVLDNDSDPDGDPLEITAVTDPANGTAIIFDNGTPEDPTDDQIVYTPDAGFNGTDSFTYSISDGQGGTASATVTVTVEGNEAPIAADDACIIAADASISIAVLGNDSDPDGEALTIDGVTDPANGTASIDGTLVSYTPDAGFIGDDSFTYTISDPSGQTATAVVSISVQASPLTGTDGDDRIFGNDLLSIDSGGIRERIDGAEGNDTIAGNGGADILVGGAGADLFVYLSLADSSADPDATNEGGDDILDFNPAEDVIQLNFDVAPGTQITLDDVQINLGFIADGVALIGLSTANTGPDFLPEQFVIRLSNLDPTTTAEQIQNTLIF